MFSSPAMIILRSLLRNMGLTKFLGPLVDRLQHRKTVDIQVSESQSCVIVNGARLFYTAEDLMRAAQKYKDDGHILNSVLERLRPSDVFWDVGANLGFYTILLARHLSSGSVIAFEPEPRCLGMLASNIALNDLKNVQVMPVALADKEGEMGMTSGEDDVLSGTSRLADTAATATVSIPVITGDLVRARNKLPVPQAVKIDVEGWEEEVISGLKNTLQEPQCHTILFEVHFKLLEARGRKLAPDRIVTTLRQAGFSKVRWLDSSHFLAQKSIL